MTQGKGHVLFGGLTTPNFWDPEAEAAAARENILAFAAGRQLAPDQVHLSIKLGYPADGELHRDGFKLTVKDLALGDIPLDGLPVTVDVDGFVVSGVLNASGKSLTVVDDAVTKITVKAGRPGSLVVSHANADIGCELHCPFLCPVDAEIRVDVPVVISIGTHRFTATLPASYSGHAKTTSGLVRSLHS